MVKLEGASGSVVFVNPSAVILIAEAVPASQSVVHTNGVCSATVKGTPEEVHAKLFPETAEHALEVAARLDAEERQERLRLARWVMEKVAFIYADRMPTDVVAAANKALGREGA